MTSLTNKLWIGLVGVGLLTTACDTPGNVELAKTEVQGRTTVTLTHEIQWGDFDAYNLTVRDSTGKVIANMRTRSPSSSDAKVITDRGTYTLADKSYRVEDKK